MSLSFVGSATSPAGTPVHITVYSNGVAVDPTLITWSGVPATVSIMVDATGFSFSASVVVNVAVVAHQGVALGTLNLNFTAPPLQFTSP